MTLGRHYIILTILVYYCTSAVCQEIKPVIVNKYTQKDGLSSYFVTKILRDSYGFTWVATQEGLNVTDGRSFEVFSSYSVQHKRLGGTFVHDILEDKKRNLMWALTAYGDVCGIDLNTRTITHRVTAFNDGSKLSLQWLQSLSILGDTLLIGGNNGLNVYNIPQKKFVPFILQKPDAGNSATFNIGKILKHGDNRVWVFDDGYGVFILNRKLEVEKQFHAEFGNSSTVAATLRFWDACIYANKVFAATSMGLRAFEAAGNNFSYNEQPTKSNMDRAEIVSTCITRYGTIFCSMENQLYAFDLNTNKTAIYKDFSIEEDWLSITRQLYYDSTTQQIWVGTQAGLGYFFLKKPLLTPFSTSGIKGMAPKHIYSLLPDEKKGMYCGDENGLMYVDMKDRKSVLLDASPSTLLVFRDNNNNVFISNNNGFQILKKNKLMPVSNYYPELTALKNDHISAGMHFNDSLMVLSSIDRRGLIIWNTRQKKVYYYHNDSLGHRVEGLTIINFLYKTNKGSLLILTEKNIIDFNPITGIGKSFFLSGKQPGNILNNFMDACETPTSYWIASYGGGLIETDKTFRVKKILSLAEGLGNPAVYRVFATKNNHIIATTNYGLSVINYSDYTIRNYLQSDGVHSDAFEQLCGYQSGDTIYAGGVKGFTLINPELFTDNKIAPRLLLSTVRIKYSSGQIDTTDFSLKRIELPPDVQQLTLYLSALNYTNPSRVSYQYKIVGKQNDWINQGNKNYIDLVPLSPGTYRLQIRSANESGMWNEIPLEIELVYLPKWYQTFGFKLSLFLLPLALFYAFYRYRLGQIKKQQQIRKEIASDLHDDIGSSLNTVKIFAHLAHREPENPGHFTRIEESLSQVSLGLRDIIWVLDDAQDNLYELLERIKRFAIPACQAKDIIFSGEISGDSDKGISKAEKRNLLLIAKEAINNSLKYAQCHSISVKIEQSGKNISLKIADDGIGFDANNPLYGNGLKNMHYRAKQIAFSVKINSILRNGTQIELTKI
jgi:ligand-binding sensor domain-containing protein